MVARCCCGPRGSLVWSFGGERLSDVSCSCERESGCFAGKLMGKGEASEAGERVAGMTREAREVR